MARAAALLADVDPKPPSYRRRILRRVQRQARPVSVPLLAPTVYTGARPAVAAILSGGLANIGAYGLLRFGGELLPDELALASTALIVVGCASIVYGGLLAVSRVTMSQAPPDGRDKLAWRIRRHRARAASRLAAGALPILQGTAAAAVAWVIARYVFDHHEPFFAPVAAVIALNTSLGERGLNAMRLLLGVLVGIVAGSIMLAALGSGSGSLALATLLAMTIAVAFGGARIVVAQAAVGAILTVAIGEAGAGVERLADALIGAGSRWYSVRCCSLPNRSRWCGARRRRPSPIWRRGSREPPRRWSATTRNWRSERCQACASCTGTWPTLRARGGPAPGLRATPRSGSRSWRRWSERARTPRTSRSWARAAWCSCASRSPRARRNATGWRPACGS